MGRSSVAADGRNGLDRLHRLARRRAGARGGALGLRPTLSLAPPECGDIGRLALQSARSVTVDSIFIE